MKKLVFILAIIFVAFSEVVFAQEKPQFHHFKIRDSLRQKQRSDDDLYTRILDALGNSYQSIGEKLTGNVINLNDDFDLGSKNFNGITWQRGFGDFNIGVNRNLSPDLFDDHRWIVDDTFTIVINASSYLSNLSKQGEIDISDDQLALFAGVNFKRNYRYVHFASNFLDGLTSDYSKLFLNFWKMRQVDIFNLDEYELLGREDSMSIQAGALISTPPILGGVSVSGGVLATYSKVSRVEIQRVGQSDDKTNANEALRLSFEKEEGFKTSTTLKVQEDFFNLLKITLFSYEMDYQYSETDKKYLSFSAKNLRDIQNDSSKMAELKNLLRLKKQPLEALKDYAVSQEYRQSQNFSSRYSALIWGGESSRGSDTIRMSNKSEDKTFIREHIYSVSFKDKIVNTLAGVIFAAIFKTDKYIHQYQESLTRSVSLEFEANGDAASDGYDRIASVDSESKLSLVISKEYKTRKTFKSANQWQKSNERQIALDFAKRFTSLDTSIINGLAVGSLQSPLSINTVIRINKDAIKALNDNSVDYVLNQFMDVCRDSNSDETDFEYCYNLLEGKYKAYIIPYMNNGSIKITKLKSFIYSLNKYTDDVVLLQNLFGGDLTFVSGSLEATNVNNQIFMTYFSQGAFSGVGVLDDFKRQGGPSLPAPIINDFN